MHVVDLIMHFLLSDRSLSTESCDMHRRSVGCMKSGPVRQYDDSWKSNLRLILMQKLKNMKNSIASSTRRSPVTPSMTHGFTRRPRGSAQIAGSTLPRQTTPTSASSPPSTPAATRTCRAATTATFRDRQSWRPWVVRDCRHSSQTLTRELE